jgi:hypothetical protein
MLKRSTSCGIAVSANSGAEEADHVTVFAS